MKQYCFALFLSGLRLRRHNFLLLVVYNHIQAIKMNQDLQHRVIGFWRCVDGVAYKQEHASVQMVKGHFPELGHGEGKWHEKPMRELNNVSLRVHLYMKVSEFYTDR